MRVSNKELENITNPPGGILIWIVIFLELFTFCIAIVGFLYFGKENTELFISSTNLLNSNIGTLNTIILILSGYFIALSVHNFKVQNIKASKISISMSISLGTFFVIIKVIEYIEKIENELIFDYNIFFTFYWIMTAFHLIHVLLGLGILIYFLYSINKINLFDFQAGAAFWHLCDLIWIILFPSLYLLYKL